MRHTYQRESHFQHTRKKWKMIRHEEIEWYDSCDFPIILSLFLNQKRYILPFNFSPPCWHASYPLEISPQKR
jgi:hypothetical protein